MCRDEESCYQDKPLEKYPVGNYRGIKFEYIDIKKNAKFKIIS
jgi:hypothetical protein